MPSVMLGRERFALPIGETRVGGAGAGALPFAALRSLPAVAVLLVTPSETASLWPIVGNDAGTLGITVNGVPLGAEPLAVTHGAKIEVAGLRLIFRDGRETGATGETVTLARQQPAGVGEEAASAPDADVIPEAVRLAARGATTAVAIPDSGLVIGRDADSDLVVAGPEVSRRHAVLRRTARGYVLTDVSRNGTFVNGRRVAGSCVLRVGDTVRIGEQEFTFEEGSATQDAAATRAALPEQPPVEPPTARARPPSARVWRRIARLFRG